MHDVVEIAAQSAVPGRMLYGQLPIAEDGSQHIIEVVGDAAGQCADRLHFLRLPQLRLQTLFFQLRLFLLGDIHGRAHEPRWLARYIERAPAACQQPVPFAVGIVHSVLALEARHAAGQVVLHGRLDPRPVLLVHRDAAHPLASRSDGAVGALTNQHLHSGRQKQSVGGHVPVPMTFVRAFHRERVAFLAFAQRPLTAGHAFDLAQKERQQHRAEHHDDERPQRDADGLVPPEPQSALRIPRDGESQRRIPHGGDCDEVLPAVDRIHDPRVGPDGGRGEHGELAAHDVRDAGTAHEQGAIVAQQSDVALGSDLRGSIELVQVLEVHGGRHDTGEMPLRVVDAAREYHRGAPLRARGQRLAHEHPPVRVVFLRDEIRTVGDVVVRDGKAARAIELIPVGIHDRDLAHRLNPGGARRQRGITRFRCNPLSLGAIPADGIEQQQIDRLQAPRRLLRERVRQIPELALGGRNRSSGTSATHRRRKNRRTHRSAARRPRPHPSAAD